MTSRYEIHSLHAGTMTMQRPEPVFVWLVVGEGRALLVDAGLPAPEVVRTRWNTECDRGGPDVLREELAARGVAPEDVDTVVLTHLHFDHAWNLDVFPSARAVVQREELVCAIDPVPTQRGYYARDVTSAVVGRRKPDHLQVVDGDHSLGPGLDLLHIPSHTPGIMGLVVETARGRVGLPSDAGESYANWYPADPRANPKPIRYLADSYLPPHIWSESALTCIASLRRFREACDIVVPSHDWRIPRHLPGEWWAVPDSAGGD
jgi:glyoxylase-like metal-dependent hydrolase (beta-lactamase superfamily II)